MRALHAPVLALIVFVIGSEASAQPFNVDFGNAGTTPSAAYAAAGQAGTWNAVGVLPAGQRQALVGLDGVATGVNIYQIGGSYMLVSNDPATSGDDEALLDDMYLSFNNPVDLCIWFENLTNGIYVVVTYAMTPNDPNLQSRVRVDSSATGPVMVGGGWPGGHVEGTTYARHVLTVTNGRIGLHSGLLGGMIQSGMNGIQIFPAGATSVGSALLGASPLSIEQITPNPALGSQVIHLRAEHSTSGALEIYDTAGRLVQRIGLAGIGAGPSAVTWDGRDLAGARASAGVYVARALGRTTSGALVAGAENGKIVRLR